MGLSLRKSTQKPLFVLALWTDHQQIALWTQLPSPWGFNGTGASATHFMSLENIHITQWSESHPVMSDSLQPHGLYSPWNSPGQNAGVGSHSLLQGIFAIQGLNPDLPHCRQILYQLNHKGSHRILEWVAYPFSSGSSRPRNGTGELNWGLLHCKWILYQLSYQGSPDIIWSLHLILVLYLSTLSFLFNQHACLGLTCEYLERLLTCLWVLSLYCDFLFTCYPLTLPTPSPLKPSISVLCYSQNVIPETSLVMQWF